MEKLDFPKAEMKKLEIDKATCQPLSPERAVGKKLDYKIIQD